MNFTFFCFSCSFGVRTWLAPSQKPAFALPWSCCMYWRSCKDIYAEGTLHFCSLFFLFLLTVKAEIPDGQTDNKRETRQRETNTHTRARQAMKRKPNAVVSSEPPFSAFVLRHLAHLFPALLTELHDTGIPPSLFCFSGINFCQGQVVTAMNPYENGIQPGSAVIKIPVVVQIVVNQVTMERSLNRARRKLRQSRCGPGLITSNTICIPLPSTRWALSNYFLSNAALF